MLVISRRPEQTVEFPNLGISIRIVRVAGQIVRIGIDAPDDVAIVRGELGTGQKEKPAKSEHQRRNRLNKVTLALHLARQQCAAGKAELAEKTLALALEQLSQLCQLENGSAGGPNKCRTLVVDDDSNERGLLAGLLNMYGYDCATAADGNDAMEYLATHEKPDVVLLDMIMPRCDGPETLRRIRADRRFDGIKVFSVSGTNPEQMGVPIGPGGIDAWFPKPLDPQKLCRAIQAHGGTAIAN